MSRFVCAFILLSAILAVSAHNVRSGLKTETTVRDIKVVKDIGEFTRTHPGLKAQRLVKQPAQARTQTVTYTLGGRVRNDKLVAQGADTYSYNDKKDVTIQLTYPESGTGKIVTYVLIKADQDNNEGNAYVVAGGIGQRFISIVVEAQQTKEFSYTAQFYGTD